jgi:hypothetical protein
VGLLVIGRVHEVVAVAIGVQELHLDFVNVDLLNRVRRTEAVLKHGTGAQVAQFGLDESTQVAGRAVFDAENGVQIIVVLDDHAGTQLGGRDRHRLKNSPYTIAVEAGGRRAGPLVPPPAYYAKKAKALFYTELRRKRNLPEAELIEDEPITILLIGLAGPLPRD